MKREWNFMRNEKNKKIKYINYKIYNKTMKGMIFLIIFLFIGLVGASQISELSPVQKNVCINLPQSNNVSYENITYVQMPDKSFNIINTEMTKDGNFFYYQFCNTSQIGDYIVNGFDEESSWAYSFSVTETGDSFDNSQGLMVLAQLGMVALFTGLGFSFSKEKWKIRSLFFMAALLMGIITLNSIRIISGASDKLSSMGNIGLILGIVVLIFMFAYLLIYYTIEVFKYYKDKRKMKWEVSQDEN